jgi:hypothetical protein
MKVARCGLDIAKQVSRFTVSTIVDGYCCGRRCRAARFARFSRHWHCARSASKRVPASSDVTRANSRTDVRVSPPKALRAAAPNPLISGRWSQVALN